MTVRERLPQVYIQEMQQLLGEECPAYLASLDQPVLQGLRVNTLKWSADACRQFLPDSWQPVPWIPHGFYRETPVPMSRTPYYQAGLYYLQEPSAMLPARLLPARPGQRLLDLCAAPGGKTTELAARMEGRGFLLANDISASRAMGLLKNLELAGAVNSCVTSEPPEKLAQIYPDFFDGILADAPCSGEGMFRREPDMLRDWQEKGPDFYVPLQRSILQAAVRMLKPGGYLLYSTCTFSVKENEGNVRWLLETCPDMETVPVSPMPAAGCESILEGCIRLYPHRVKGEGQFAALLRKKPDAKREAADIPAGTPPKGIRKKPPEAAAAFLDRLQFPWESGVFYEKGEQLYWLGEGVVPVSGVRYLRTGLLLGTVKSGRFEPAQALAMVLNSRTCPDSLSFSANDPRLIRYLKGETIFLDEGQTASGWQLVCADGFGLGFAKGSGASLKNKYYPGWRWT